MVGSGVFSTSGVLLETLSPDRALLAWLVGGLASLAGAWVYAELAVAIRESGGEYALVSRYVHPAAGFVVGLVTFLVGFCAPIAASALAFARYGVAALSGDLPPEGEPASAPELALALAVILIPALLQAREAEPGRRSIFVGVQNAASLAKLVALAALVVLGLAAIAAAPPEHAALFEAAPAARAPSSLLSLGLGVVLTSYAYSGWNAAAYFAGDVRAPETTLPRALAGGTSLVIVLYLLVNVVILASAPRAALVGEIAVGHVAARALFGEPAARLLSAVIALGLFSTTSAFLWTGARLARVMGERHPRLAWLTSERAALGLEVIVALGLLATASFDVLLGSVGFTIALASALAVLCVFRVRREGAAYRAPLHPLPALFYLALVGWVVGSTLIARPSLAWVALAATLVGLVGYAVVSRKSQ